MNYAEIARWSVVASSIAFAIVAVWGFRKLAIPAIAASSEAKNNELAVAEARLEKMRAKVVALQAALATADAEAASIRTRAQEQSERERAAALEESKVAGERVIRNAQGELDRARAAAGEALRDEFLQRALEEARTQATHKADASVNARLLDRFIESIQHGGLN